MVDKKVGSDLVDLIRSLSVSSGCSVPTVMKDYIHLVGEVERQSPDCYGMNKSFGCSTYINCMECIGVKAEKELVDLYKNNYEVK